MWGKKDPVIFSELKYTVSQCALLRMNWALIIYVNSKTLFIFSRKLIFNSLYGIKNKCQSVTFILCLFFLFSFLEH